MLLAHLIPAAVVALCPVNGRAVPPVAPRAVPVLAPVPKAPPRAGVIVVNSFQPHPSALVLAPDGKEVREVAMGAALKPINPGDRPTCPLLNGRLSPDGKRLAAFRLGPIPQNNVGPWTPMHLWVFDVESKDGPDQPLMPDIRLPFVAWGPDGTKLYGSHIDPEKEADAPVKGKPPALVSWEYDFKTRKKAPLALPVGHAILDVSPDGSALLTVVQDSATRGLIGSYIVPLNTLKPRPLTKTDFEGMRFSPDGKSVIGRRLGKKGDDPPPALLAVASVADGSERAIALPPEVQRVRHACWSPDGKRIAYWSDEENAAPPAPGGNAPPREWASRVTVIDTDGRNPTPILRRENDQSIYGLDWK